MYRDVPQNYGDDGHNTRIVMVYRVPHSPRCTAKHNYYFCNYFCNDLYFNQHLVHNVRIAVYRSPRCTAHRGVPLTAVYRKTTATTGTTRIVMVYRVPHSPRCTAKHNYYFCNYHRQPGRAKPC
jgi:hypothetical protein